MATGFDQEQVAAQSGIKGMSLRVTGYLPVMIAITDDGFARSVISRAADRFGKLNGARTYVITTPPRGAPTDVHPSFYKAWLWDMVPENVDRIMFMDFDIIPIRPLGELPDCEFGACMGYSGLPAISKCLPFIQKTGMYFNAGMFLAHRSTRPVFDRVKLFATSLEHSFMRHIDQAVFNVLMQHEVNVTILPEDWSYQLSVVGGEYVKEPKLLHFSAMTTGRWHLMSLALDILEADGSAALLGKLADMDRQNG